MSFTIALALLTSAVLFLAGSFVGGAILLVAGLVLIAISW